MKISEFAKSMLPFFNRSRVQDDLRNTTTELNTIVLPSIAMLAKELKGPLKSDLAKEVTGTYKQSVRTTAPNIFADLATRLPKLAKTLEALANVVNTEFEDKIASAGLSVRKANVVRVLGVINFIDKYTMSLANALIHQEMKHGGATLSYISDVTEGELVRLRKYMVDYVQFIAALTEVKDPLKAFTDIPDVIVEAEAHVGVFGSDKLDPFRVFGQSNFRGSPFYLIVMLVAEYQHNQHRKMESQKQALEKRLIALKRSTNGQPSPKVEEELEIISSRIASLTETLRTYEESLA